MKNEKRNLLKKIYQEELIRIDFHMSLNSNPKEKLENFSELLVQKRIYSIYTKSL